LQFNPEQTNFSKGTPSLLLFYFLTVRTSLLIPTSSFLLPLDMISFLQVYSLLDQGKRSFESVKELLSSLKLYNLTQESLRTHLLQEGIGATYVDEMITGIMRINYAQDAELNALVGFVSLIGHSEEELDAIYGGNRQLCECFLRGHKEREGQGGRTRLLLNSEVTRVIKRSNEVEGERKRFQVEYLQRTELSSGEGDSLLLRVEEFDAVIIATPLELTSITLDGEVEHLGLSREDEPEGTQTEAATSTEGEDQSGEAEKPVKKEKEVAKEEGEVIKEEKPTINTSTRKYQTVHVTLLIGRLRSSYFEKRFKTSTSSVPSSLRAKIPVLPHRILTTENKTIPFNSLMAWEVLPGGRRMIYKVSLRHISLVIFLFLEPQVLTSIFHLVILPTRVD
jgi:hypothetical protein